MRASPKLSLVLAVSMSGIGLDLPLVASAAPASAMSSTPCDTARAVILRDHLFLGPPPLSLTCQAQQRAARFEVMSVRYCCRTVDEGPGSNLVGYFAVRRSDGRVFEWDFAAERVVGRGHDAVSPRLGETPRRACPVDQPRDLRRATPPIAPSPASISAQVEPSGTGAALA